MCSYVLMIPVSVDFHVSDRKDDEFVFTVIVYLTP